MGLKPLTPRERKFVEALFVTTPVFNGSEAARAVGFSEKSCRVAAVRMLTKDNVKAAIEAARHEAEKALEITKDGWFKKLRCFYHGDVRKLFDEHNNPIDIPLLGDNEAVLIEGFECVEDFIKVKDNKGGEQAVCTGYTKKIKYTKPKEAHEYVGKVMGWVESDDNPSRDLIPPRVEVILVDAPGGNVQVNVGSTARAKPKVHFVG